MKHLQDYIVIHRQNPRYGPGPTGVLVSAMAHEIRGVNPKRTIDWGCGNSKVLMVLCPSAECTLYDPAIPGFDAEPVGRFDLGICTDVMEHIPDDEIDETFRRQAALCDDWLYIIDTKVALQHLSDGTNAHVSQHPSSWWFRRMERFFRTLESWPCDSTRFYIRAMNFNS